MAKGYEFLVANGSDFTIYKVGESSIDHLPDESSFYNKVKKLGRQGYYVVSVTEYNKLFMEREINVSGNEKEND